MLRRSLLAYLAILAIAAPAAGLGIAELPYATDTFSSVQVNTQSPKLVKQLTISVPSGAPVAAWADWNLTTTGAGTRYYTCTLVACPDGTCDAGGDDDNGPGSCLDTAASADFQTSQCGFHKYGKRLVADENMGGAVARGFTASGSSLTVGLYCESNKDGAGTGVYVTLTGQIHAVSGTSHDQLVSLNTRSLEWAGTAAVGTSYGDVDAGLSGSLTVPTGGAKVLLIGAASFNGGASGDRKVSIQIADGGTGVAQAGSQNVEASTDMESATIVAVTTLGSGCSGGTCTRTLSLQAKSAVSVDARSGMLWAMVLKSTNASGTDYKGDGANGAGPTTGLANNTSVTNLTNVNQATVPSGSIIGPIVTVGSATFFPNDSGSAARPFYSRLHECSGCVTAPSSGDTLGAVFNGYSAVQEPDEYMSVALMRIKSSESGTPPHRISVTGSSGDATNTIDAETFSVGTFSLRPDNASIPPTWTPSPTATNTSAPPTATNTTTPTIGPGCYIAAFDISTSANDVVWQSTNNGAATLTTNSTGDLAGKWFFGAFQIENNGGVKWDTSAIPDTAVIVGATLTINVQTATIIGAGSSRLLNGKWQTVPGAWATTDYEDPLTPGSAFSVPMSQLHVGQFRFDLSDPAANINKTGTTAIQIGGSGGDPASGTDEFAVRYDTYDTVSGYKPHLEVVYCDPTPTPGPSNTATTTATRTPLSPKFRIPDMNGDGQRGLALAGGPSMVGVADDLQGLLAVGDPDMICLWAQSDEPSSTFYQQQAALSAAAAPGRCSVPGVAGTLYRGTNIFADVVIVDVCFPQDKTLTWTQPAAPPNGPGGTCYTVAGPTPGACRVNAPSGNLSAGRNSRCSQGASFGSACRRPGPGVTPTPCLDDPDPTDQTGRTSACKDNLFGGGDDVDVTGCATGLCGEQTRDAATLWNVREGVGEIEARGAYVILTCGKLPAYWLNPDDPASATPVITPVPNGTPMPTPQLRAVWEPAWRLFAYLRQALRPLAAAVSEGGNLRGWVDIEALAADRTGSQPWKMLGNAATVDTMGLQGHCTCLLDADCGAGGVCSEAGGAGIVARYCSAGARASCVTDLECAGSNSIAHPGEAYCIRDGDGWQAEAIQACLEEWQTYRDPSWHTKGILDCSGMPPSGKYTPFPTPTYTAIPTSTFTPAPALTPTNTATHTPGAAPTSTSTATATATVLAPLPSSTVGSTSACWKAGGEGKMADIFGAQLRRQVTEYSQCFWSKGFPLASSTCDLSTGQSGEPRVPTDILWAITVPGESSTNTGVGRAGYHAVEDKLRKFCTDDEIRLHWSWVRYRAHQLGVTVPADMPIPFGVYEGANGVWPWDGWFKGPEPAYSRPLLDQIRADIVAHAAGSDPVCGGNVMNEMGFRLLDDWMTRGRDICYQAYSSAAVNNNCAAAIKPSQAQFKTWCDGYKTFLKPLWQGIRAAEGFDCRIGHCSVETDRWCTDLPGEDHCDGLGETCVMTGAAACP